MAKVVLNNLTTLTGSAVTTLNNNFDAIEAAMENTLSRDGDSPNSMQSNFDMNSYRIENLVAAVSDTEPVRLREFQDGMDDLEATVQAIATTTQGYLNSVTTIYDQFDDRYLGNKASDPTVDNDGGVLVSGTLYFNTTSGVMKVYNGSAWGAVVGNASGTALDDFADVVITSAASGDVLRYDGANWVDYPDSNYQPHDADLDTWAGLTPSANHQTLVTQTFAQMRASLDLEVGTDFLSPAAIAAAYQPLDADLTSIAALTTTAYGRSFLELANAAAAQTLAGLVIGTNVQAYDADLTTWAGITPSANAQSLVSAADYAAMRALLDLEAGTDFLSPAAIAAAYQPLDADLTTWAGLTPSANAQSLVTAANYAAMKALLDLEIGVDVQAYDADLTTWAGLTPSANAQSLVTAANYAAMRTLLDLEAGTDFNAYDAQLADIAGITFAQGDILYFNGTNLVALGPGTSGHFLKTNGAAANPAWTAIAGGGDLLAANNLSDVASAATAFSNIKQAASETATGVVELATTAEVVTGTDTTRAVTAAGVAAAIAAIGTTGYPPGHIFGLTMSNAADASNDITIDAGSARDDTDTDNMVLAAAITKQLDATWAVGDAAGGLNTGAEANSTWYEVHLIKRSDTGVVDVMFTTTANRATLPTNYDLKRRIGWIRNSGAGAILAFTQVEDYFTWTTQVADATAVATTTTATALTMTVPPSTIARFRATLVGDLTDATHNDTYIVFSEIVEGNVTPAISLASLSNSEYSAGEYMPVSAHFELRVSSTSTIEHDSDETAGAFYVNTYGWIDSRGRHS